MGLDLVVEGKWLKANSANEELKVGSWGFGGEGGVVLICPKVTLHVALQNVFGADHRIGATLGVVSYFPLRQLGVVSEKPLCCLETSIKCCLFGCLGLTWSCSKNWLLRTGLHYIKT